MCDLCLVSFFFIKIFTPIQKCIVDFVNIGKLIYFSNVVKCVRPTYGNKEARASLM